MFFASMACGGSDATPAGGGDGSAPPGGGADAAGAGDSGANATDATSAKCPDFIPCGGAVVGTWVPDPICKPATQVSGGNGCAGETWDVSTVMSEIAWTFRADLTMSVDLTTSGFATVTTSDMCLAQNGVTACADAGPTYARRILFVGGKASSGGCTTGAAGCRCTIDFTPTPVAEPGTYSLSATQLSARVADDTAEVFDYCVTGSKLQMRLVRNGAPTGAPASYVRR
jgi:hypothetical protein